MVILFLLVLFLPFACFIIGLFFLEQKKAKWKRELELNILRKQSSKARKQAIKEKRMRNKVGKPQRRTV